MDGAANGRRAVSWADAGLFLAIVLAAAAPYVEIIRHGYFLSDDVDLLYHARRLGIAQFFTPELYRNGVFDFIRPVGLLLWKINYLMYGLDPVGYHLTNVLLHVTASLSVYFLASAVLRERAACFLAALLFAVHPVHAEAVDWLAARYDLLCTIFYVLGLTAYIKHARGGDGTARPYLASLLFMALALLSKEMAATFPLAVIIYELFFHRQNGTGLKSALWRTAPFFAVLAAYMLLRLMLFHGMGGYIMKAGSIHARLSSPAALVVRLQSYMRALLFGINLEYPFHPAVTTLAALLALGGGAALSLRGGRDRRAAAMLMAIVLASFMPVINFASVFGNLMASRFMYLPSAFLCVALGALLAPRAATAKAAAVPAACALLLTATYTVTLVRNQAPWVEASFIGSTLPEHFKKYCPKFPRGAEITVFNAPSEYAGALVYLESPYVFARSLQMSYGFPDDARLEVDFRKAGPGEVIRINREPRKGCDRRVILEYDDNLECLHLLYDSRGANKNRTRFGSCL